MDTDGDGIVTRKELQDYLKSLKIQFTDEEIDEMVNEADIDNDGEISDFFNVSFKNSGIL